MNMPMVGVALASIAMVVVACDREANRAATPGSNTTTPASRADNTDRNKVDRDSTTKTPVNQDNTAEATRITAEIRRAIVADKSMSTNAQNCKIIADSSGVVTLRGPVASMAEKDAIGAIAKAVTGVTSVVNELEVK